MVQNSAEYQYGYEVEINGAWHGQSGVYDWPGVVEACRALGGGAQVRVYDRTGLFWQGTASAVPSEKPAARAGASVGAPVQTTATPPSAEGERPEQVVARLDAGEPAPPAPEPKAVDLNSALSAPARPEGEGDGTVGVPPAATPTQPSSGQPKKARLRVFSNNRTRDLAPSGLAYYCCLTGRRWAGEKEEPMNPEFFPHVDEAEMATLWAEFHAEVRADVAKEIRTRLVAQRLRAPRVLTPRRKPAALAPTAPQYRPQSPHRRAWGWVRTTPAPRARETTCNARLTPWRPAPSSAYQRGPGLRALYPLTIRVRELDCLCGRARRPENRGTDDRISRVLDGERGCAE